MAYDYRNEPVMHYAAWSSAEQLYHRGCNHNRTMRRANGETDTDDKQDVSCIRCRRSESFRRGRYAWARMAR